MLDRKKYMKEVYSKYWIDAREKIYGFSDYDKNLCSLLINLAGDVREKKILEVAIGTGCPFASFFDSVGGAEIYGTDIAPSLIAKCKETYPNISCQVGDAERLPYEDNVFDFVYCFHSSWYFPNLDKAIDEMIRTTKSCGFIAFDIQNRNNPSIADGYKKECRRNVGGGKIKQIVKNLIKIAIRRGTPCWHFMVYETPTYPEDICQMLEENLRVRSYNLYGRMENNTLDQLSTPSLEYDRLVFVAHIK